MHLVVDGHLCGRFWADRRLKSGVFGIRNGFLEIGAVKVEGIEHGSGWPWWKDNFVIFF